MKELAPIVLFVYNRPWHIRQTLEALSKNLLADQSKLYIYADGPKENATEEQLQKIKEVRKLVREKKWCGGVEIIEREKNMGLANSVIAGVTEIVNKYGKIIVLEDDLVTSVGFLKYMNDALELYKNEESVMHISGYMFPVKSQLPKTFFLRVSSCWGWGAWKRSWMNFCSDSKLFLKKIKHGGSVYEFNLEDGYDYWGLLNSHNNQSWAINWYASVFLKHGLCLHPGISLVRNIGFDNSGSNCIQDRVYLNQPVTAIVDVFVVPLIELEQARLAVRKFLMPNGSKNIFIRILARIKKELSQHSKIRK